MIKEEKDILILEDNFENLVLDNKNKLKKINLKRKTNDLLIFNNYKK